MTGSQSSSERAFAEELLLEGRGGPSALYVRDQARGVARAVHAGAALAPDDVGALVDLLGDPRAFVNEPTEPAHLREENRRRIAESLLVHACRTDDPLLVRRLRQVAPSEVHRVDLRLQLSAPCLLALFEGLDQDELAVRHTAMRMVGNIHRQTDITPVLDIVIGELVSPEHGRGHRRVAPADGARSTLVDYSLHTDGFDSLYERVTAVVAPSAPTRNALRTLAALCTVAERFALVTGLVQRAATRTPVIGGIHDAVCRIAWNLELEWHVPNARYPFAEAMTVAEGLATNAGHRKQVEDMRRRYDRLRSKSRSRL
ncbi:hypothetical protein [Streptomyces sp. WMMC940]|uniref:hypothetical protein n=1 Tax=Streptomyces sp. WMMC940 TaxID=3015153 RepID=UPI0022B75077|nr:hypothetical protein [Streptomyces sp. WMMC940]MCZ7456741.1 hypothetical protein [Streptomyces sp. WMMC940]